MNLLDKNDIRQVAADFLRVDPEKIVLKYTQVQIAEQGADGYPLTYVLYQKLMFCTRIICQNTNSNNDCTLTIDLKVGDGINYEPDYYRRQNYIIPKAPIALQRSIELQPNVLLNYLETPYPYILIGYEITVKS